MTPTRYRIACADPHAHLFEVACTVDDPASEGQVFRLPAWVPGSYLIREFARHFVAVRAWSGGAPVAVEKVSKDAWQAASCAGPLTLVAQVYAFDLSVRAAYLDAARGFFNGPAVFVWPVGHELRPCLLEIAGPTGTAGARWRVATSMPRADAAPYGFGTYRASNYDELVDHPVEMGAFDLAAFRRGWRAPRHCDHRPSSRRPRPPPGRHAAHLPGADRFVRRCDVQPRANRPLRLPAPGTRRRLRRPRASREHQPRFRTQQSASARRAASRRRLSQVARTGEPRVFPHLERQAHQACRIPALRSLAGGLYHSTVGVRGNHLVLRRPDPGSLRTDRDRQLPGTARAEPDRIDARAGADSAKHCRIEFRRLDQILST